MSDNSSKLLTRLAPDDPVKLDASYSFNDDRRRIDNQILTLQRVATDLLLSGVSGTYVTLDGNSQTPAVGQCVCTTGHNVTLATSSAVANASAVSGVVLRSGAPGSTILVATMGSIPYELVPALGPGTASVVRWNTSTLSLERTSSLSTSDLVVGTVDTTGQLTMSVQSTIAAANSAQTTANAASASAASAVTTANAAQATANTASTNASNAVTTANAASSTANTASTNASNAVTTANAASSTANTASTNASTALSTANSASSAASSAQTTANTAVTNASAAQSTANTASTNASNALVTIRGQSATNDTPAIGYNWSHDGSNWRAKRRSYKDARDFGCVLDGVTDDTTALQAAFNSIVPGDKLVIRGPLKTTSETVVPATAHDSIIEFSAPSPAAYGPSWFASISDAKGTGMTLSAATSETFQSDSAGTSFAVQTVVPCSFSSTTQLSTAFNGFHIWTYDATTSSTNEGEWIFKFVSSTGTGPYTTNGLLFAVRPANDASSWTPPGSDTVAWRLQRHAFRMQASGVVTQNLNGGPAHGFDLHHFLHCTSDDTLFTAENSSNHFEKCTISTDQVGFLRFGATVAEEYLPKVGSTNDSPLRLASHAYNLNQRVRPATPNGYYYICTTPGTSASGGDPAAWSSTSARGQTNTDGSVTWTSGYDCAGFWTPLNCDVYRWDKCTFEYIDCAGVFAGNNEGESVAHVFEDCSFNVLQHAWKARVSAQADFRGGAYGSYGTLFVYGASQRRVAIDSIMVEGCPRLVEYQGTGGASSAISVVRAHGNMGDPRFPGEMHPSGELMTFGGQGPFTVQDCEVYNPSSTLADGHIQLTDTTATGSTSTELKLIGNNVFSKTRARTGQKAKIASVRRGPFNLSSNTDLQVRMSTDAGLTWFNSSITFTGASFRYGLSEARADEIAIVLRTRAPVRANNVGVLLNTVVRADSSIRANSKAYVLNQIVFNSAYAQNSNIAFQCTTAGTSGSSEPSAMAATITTGAVITDGSVTWTSVMAPSVYFNCTTAGSSGTSIPALFATTTTTGVTITDGSVTWTSIAMWPAEILSATGGVGFGDGGLLTLYSRGSGSQNTQLQVTGGAANTKFAFSTGTFAGKQNTQINVDSNSIVDCDPTGTQLQHVTMSPPKLIDFSTINTTGLPTANALDHFYRGGQYSSTQPLIASPKCATIVSATGVPQNNLCALVTISGTATSGFGGFFGNAEADVNYQVMGRPMITAVTGSPTIPAYEMATPLKNGVGITVPTAPGAGNSITYQVFVGRAPVPAIWTPASVTSATLVGDYNPDTLSTVVGVINDTTNPWANSATGTNLCPTLVQATASSSAQPTVVAGPNGHNKVVFDGVAQFIQGSSGTFGSGGVITTPYTQFTIVVIGKALTNTSTLTTSVAANIVASTSKTGYQTSTGRATMNGVGGLATPVVTVGNANDPMHPHCFIARYGSTSGTIAPCHGGFVYDGVEAASTNWSSTLTQFSFTQPMVGKSASGGDFTNFEIYRLLIYTGWPSAADAQRITDFSRGQYNITNF